MPLPIMRPPRRAAKGFVRGSCNDVETVVKWVLGLARHDKPGYMRHICHEQTVRANFFGDGGKLGIVEFARVRAEASENDLGFVLESKLTQLVVVYFASGNIFDLGATKL